MDDKKTAIAIFLSILVILVYTEVVMAPYSRPAPTVTRPAQVERPSADLPPLIPEQQDTAPLTPQSADRALSPSLPTPQAGALEPPPSASRYLQSPQTVVVSSNTRITFSHLGARITSLQLINHRATIDRPDPVEMVNQLGPIFPLGVYLGGVSDAAVEYSLESVSAGAAQLADSLRVPSGGSLRLVFAGELANGNPIRKIVTIQDGSYLFEVEVNLGSPMADLSPIMLEWVRSYIGEERETQRWSPLTFVSLNLEESIRRVPAENAPELFSDLATKWTSFGDNYFIAALIPQIREINTRIAGTGESYFMRARGTPSTGHFALYVGPKGQVELNQAGFELERGIDLGWFAFIGQPILIGIELLFELLGNYGLAIILFTLLLKAALLPLTRKSFKSMKAMQDLQGEIKLLRDKFEDPNERNREMMALYKRRGVNPFGGCFPMVLQIPIFLGMYNALRTSSNLRHAPFALWINDLAAPEQLEVAGIPIPVMILIMGASMLVQQLTTPSSATPEQKRIMIMMPIVFTGMFIIMPFPSGLVLYWLVNNLISIVQQVSLRSEHGLSPLQATAAGGVLIFIFSFLLTLL